MSSFTLTLTGAKNARGAKGKAGDREGVNVLKHLLLAALRGTQRSHGLTQWGLSCVPKKERVKTRCPAHRTEPDIT